LNKKNRKRELKSWHIYNWTFLGWAETGVKSIAITLGMWAFYLSRNSQAWILPSGNRLIQWIILGILSLGIFFAIFNRWQNKEIVSMIFVFFNNFGHWGMFLALIRNTGWFLLPYFALLMMLGDLAKILFLKQMRYTERNLSPNLFVYVTLIFVIGYGLIDLLSCLN